MLKTMILAVALLVATQALEAQRRQPLPDRWLTRDSLVNLLELSESQLSTVGPHLDSLNSAIQVAAERRAGMRAAVRAGGGGGGAPSDEMRIRMQALRQELDSLQTETDTLYGAIRAGLTAEQRAKFDALAKPVVAPGRSGRRRG